MQSSPSVLSTVFNIAFGKVFQELKFEYMPRFLTSEAFVNLKDFKKYFSNEDDTVSVALQLVMDVDVDACLRNAWGTSYFLVC